jgi:hypothetical protein
MSSVARTFRLSIGVNSSVDAAWSAGGWTTPSFFDANVGASWARYSFTATIPATARTVQFGISSNGSNMTSGSTVNVAGVQVELGSTASPFRRNANSIQGELAACQRYYWRTPLRKDSSKVPFFGIGSANSTSQINAAFVQLPVQMRDVPYAIDYAGSIQVVFPAVNAWASTSVTLGTYSSTTAAALTVNVASGSIAVGQTYNVRQASDDAYMGFSAEL